MSKVNNIKKYYLMHNAVDNAFMIQLPCCCKNDNTKHLIRRLSDRLKNARRQWVSKTFIITPSV